MTSATIVCLLTRCEIISPSKRLGGGSPGGLRQSYLPLFARPKLISRHDSWAAV